MACATDEDAGPVADDIAERPVAFANLLVAEQWLQEIAHVVLEFQRVE